MTSIKIHYRPSHKAGAQEGKLFIRIIHRRRPRSVTTAYTVRQEEWDAATETVILSTNDSARYDYLSGIAEKLAGDRRRLESLISEYSQRGEYDVDDLVDGFKVKPLDDPAVLSVYCERVCRQLETSGQERTARAYRSAVRSFERFVAEHWNLRTDGAIGLQVAVSGPSLKKSVPERTITLSDINASQIKAYEAHLLEKGLYLNTVSFYMRQLRAIFHRAIKEKMIRRREDNPFADVFTGVHKTRHRALTERELNALASLETTLNKRIGSLLHRQSGDDNHELESCLKLKNALFIFLFCFHARGMSYVDMAYLKKSDIGEESLIYKRKKTGRFLEVRITRPMREIMDWFAADAARRSKTSRNEMDSPYVFPIIEPARGRERTQYESGLRRQNRLLGLLTKMAGLDKKVTTHVSRHTWATVAKWRKVPVAVISEALGHSDIKTTEHYLASFEQSVLDKLSKEISGVIKKGDKAA